MLVRLLLTAAALIGAAEGLTVAFAARDADVARRLRELSPAVVKSATDRARNARWHHLGAWLRALTVGVLLAVAGVAVAGLPWWHVVPAVGATGGWCLRRFDYAFARRFGMAADYLGNTAALDRTGFASRSIRWWGTGLVVAGAVGWGAAWLTF